MEKKATLLSLGLSFLAMYMVYQYVSSKDAEFKKEYETFFKVVTTSRDILQYETIRPTDLEVRRVPNAMLPPGYITDPRDASDAIAAVPLLKGEFVLDNKIISKNVYSGLDTQVAVGRRAMSIPVNIKSAVGHHVRPGNRIDLAAHFEYRSSGANISEVKVFLQDILVLATRRTIQASPPAGVDQNLISTVLQNLSFSRAPTTETVRDTINYAKTDPSFTTLTLEVAPQQAQILVFVMTVFPDAITCLLRHSDDRILERRTTTNLFDVMGPDSYYGKGPKAPPPKAVVLPKFYDVVGGETISPR